MAVILLPTARLAPRLAFCLAPFSNSLVTLGSYPMVGTSHPQWALYAYQSTAALAMYRAWVSDGKVMPVEEAAEQDAGLICRGSDAWLASVRHSA